ncbi:MAG: orotate phosphoribosyltransferase [Candidatus Peregrinibacteria bacterium]|nr:orotate phosphoribosyltransferase [Candidatus Peregrinibacteria bacterium]MDZ4245310.1 orotate phosphoribosyltransferase [Candidatus Gracilibacteria bacterium]
MNEEKIDYAREVAKALLEIGAVRLKPSDPFTWTSGLKSPIYCDNRMLISHPEAYELVVDAFVDIIENTENLDFEYLAGTATAGIPWAAFLAYDIAMPMVYVRSKPKEHGAAKMIEGDLPDGSHVIVVEDLISTGGSSIVTVNALREEGSCTVTDVLAIFSYNFAKASTRFKESNVNAYTVTNIQTLTDVAVEMGKITKEEQEMVLSFTRDAEAWQAQWA